MSDLALCRTCGTQFDAQLEQPPSGCKICDDPRQFVPPGGQQWTSLAKELGKHENNFEQDPTDPRIWFISTSPTLGIGERCILICTPAGNLLWDLIAYLDQKTIDFIRSKGGLKAIAISHPHYYTTHLEWAAAFKCPIYTAAADEQWFSRKDVNGDRRIIKQPTLEILPKVTLITVGGHFDGSTVLHWANKLFTGDSIMVIPSGLYFENRQPGTASFAFMWSYPNLIPLHPSKIHGIWKAIKAYEFHEAYGAFANQNLVAKVDLRPRLLESMKIVVRAAGHESHALLEESHQ